MLLRFAMMCAMGGALLSACGGGDDGGGADATATPDTFDPRVYSAFVVRPAEVPPGLRVFTGLAPAAKSLNITYHDPVTNLQLVQSTVARIPDPVEREATFSRLRRVYAQLYANGEANYPGKLGDAAFIYSSSDPLVGGANVLLGDFIIYTQVNSYDGHPPLDDVSRYTKLVVDRVQAYIDDPGAVQIPTIEPSTPPPNEGATAGAATPTP